MRKQRVQPSAGHSTAGAPVVYYFQMFPYAVAEGKAKAVGKASPRREQRGDGGKISGAERLPLSHQRSPRLGSGPGGVAGTAGATAFRARLLRGAAGKGGAPTLLLFTNALFVGERNGHRRRHEEDEADTELTENSLTHFSFGNSSSRGGHPIGPGELGRPQPSIQEQSWEQTPKPHPGGSREGPGRTTRPREAGLRNAASGCEQRRAVGRTRAKFSWKRQPINCFFEDVRSRFSGSNS